MAICLHYGLSPLLITTVGTSLFSVVVRGMPMAAVGTDPHIGNGLLPTPELGIPFGQYR